MTKIACLVVLLLTMVSCRYSEEPVVINGKVSPAANVKEIQYKNHRYLLFTVYNKECSVVHDPECCNK